MTILEQMGVQQWRRRAQRAAANTQEQVAEEHSGQVSVSNAVSSETKSKPEPLPDLLDWSSLAAMVESAQSCPCCAQTGSVLGQGDQNAECFVVVGEPSASDIATQHLLSGRAGQLLDAILHAMDLSREKIYLSSVYKCAAKQARDSSPGCDKIIHQQIRLVKPKVVIAFGEFSAQTVIKANEQLADLRAQPQRCFVNDLPIVVSHDLRSLLEEPSLKGDTWHDVKKAMSFLGAAES